MYGGESCEWERRSEGRKKRRWLEGCALSTPTSGRCRLQGDRGHGRRPNPLGPRARLAHHNGRSNSSASATGKAVARAQCEWWLAANISYIVSLWVKFYHRISASRPVECDDNCKQAGGRDTGDFGQVPTGSRHLRGSCLFSKRVGEAGRTGEVTITFTLHPSPTIISRPSPYHRNDSLLHHHLIHY